VHDNPVHEATSATTVEVLEPTPEEESERHRLEIGRTSLLRSGCSTARIARSPSLPGTRSFDEYCRDRFGFQRRHSYRLIDAAVVVDNLCPNGTQTIISQSEQVVPTNERQVRDLIGLQADEQRSVWQQAVEEAGGKFLDASSRVS